MPRIHRTVCAALSALAAAMPLFAQTPRPAEPPPVFGEQIEVRVVNVEAVVTDKDGNRVNGLQPPDFRLRVDGKDVPVEFFTEVMGRELARLVQGKPKHLVLAAYDPLSGKVATSEIDVP